MADRVITGQYDFDPQGTNPNNLITAERQTLVVPGIDDYYFIIPYAAPFFVNSMVVMNDSTGVPYIEGTDYVIGHFFIEAMAATGSAIAGSIRFLRRNITGIVRMNYRTIGGVWGFNDTAILEELANRQYNPLVRSWGMIDPLPATFPPLPHDQLVDDLVGTDEILAGLESIATAIEAAGSGSTTAHINDLNNPHQTTKEQVGLAQLQNYPVASQSQAETGTSNSVYMTALRTAQAIAVLANGPLTTHINNQSNPHNTTKAQVGLSNVPNYPAATDIEATDGARNDRLMTPYTTALVIQSQGVTAQITALQNAFNSHSNNFSNPHQVTAAQVGTYTTAQIDTLIAGVVAGESTTFGGLTPTEWRESLPEFADVEGTINKVRDEYIQALSIISAFSPTLMPAHALVYPISLKAGYDHYVISLSNGRTIGVTGGVSLGSDLSGGSDLFYLRQNAAYYITPDGFIRNVGSASIVSPTAYNESNPTPPTIKPVMIAAYSDRVFVLLENNTLIDYIGGTTSTNIDTNVDGIYTGIDNNNRRITLYQNRTVVAAGHFDFATAMNAVLSAEADVIDVVIGNQEIFLLYNNGTVKGWSCILSGSNYTVTPLTLSPSFSTNIGIISGCADHFVFINTSGQLQTRGSNSNGQLNFNLPNAVYADVSCGVNFTVTMTIDWEIHVWGNTTDNHLNPPASYRGVM